MEKNETYVWVQGTEATSFTNWHSGHPKAGTAENSRDCVTIFLKTQLENGKWKTKQCNFTFRLFAHVQMAHAFDNDTGMFSYHFVIQRT